MKIAYASDIHLEFGGLKLENTVGADVLVLAGDISVAWDLNANPKYENFFWRVSNQFKHVIYIMGNHEHYSGDFTHTANIIREFVKKYDNIHFLDKETIVIDGVAFFGGTMWTNMNERDPYVMEYVNTHMSDFQLVTYNYATGFNTKDAARQYDETVSILEFDLATVKADKFVVVTHHAPSPKSVHQRYELDKEMNYGYHTNMEQFICNHPQIKVWIHGHVHDNFDYTVGDTNVVCNPRGYVKYEQDHVDAFELKTVEV